ncbi:diguanylate cyclase domain-containing protein [Roseateles chitosanitabidus]|uniref:diguanylate cyclase domain-containing protein n=1 Tax=Roseateles chitosanitabidus TaxID=65048 RepID=UPI00082F619F|nr:diguanylate cyclase [Roseateles chitosanitabidus]
MPTSLFRKSIVARLDARRMRALLLGPFIALGLVLVVLWALVGWFALIYPRSLVLDLQEDLQNVARDATSETEALLRETEGSLRTIDLLLLTRKSARQDRDSTVSLLADSLRDSSRGLTDVMLANADGRLWRIPSVTGEPYIQLADPAFLAALHAPGGPSIVVGTPVRLRPGAHLVLPLATRLTARAGDFDTAIAFIDLDGLLRLYRPRVMRPGMAILLQRQDGVALARWPEVAGLVGRNLREQPGVRPLPPDAPASGRFLLAESPADGNERIVAYRTLQDYPLRLFVSFERDRILAGYLTQRRALLGFSLLVSAIAIGLMAWFTRLQARTRLREAERQATADASPMGLFRCDLSGRVVYANETYLRMMEVEPATMAWGWMDRLPEVDRETVKAQWAALVASQDSVDRVRRLTRRDGTEMLVALRMRPMRIDGRIVAHAGTVLDITENARQQQASRMLSAIIDLAPDYIAQTAPDGRLLYLNPAVRHRLGLTPDAPLDGLRHERFFVDDGLTRYREEILPAAERDGHWHGRWEVRATDGRDLPVDCTVIVHRDDMGRVSTISWMLRDISAELAVERERERSQAVMSALAQSVAVMMLAVDTDEQVLFCNKAFEQRFDIPHRAWVGRGAAELLGEARYATIRPLIRRAFAGETSVVEMRDDDDVDPTGISRPMPMDGDGRGEARYVELNYAPLFNDAGAIIGAYGVARDVTEVKQEQMRLLKASNTDALTELLNRAGFSAYVDTSLRRATDRDELVSLLYLDLDRFKPVNDEYGHPVGDALLKAVAGRLRHALRPQDLVARLGGDEFAVFLHHVARPEDAQIVADKLVHALSMPFRIGALELHIGASVGFCVQWARGVQIDALVMQADEQLYHAKRAGRGRASGTVCAARPAGLPN